MKIGNITIQDLKIGNESVKAYIGSQQVFPIINNTNALNTINKE